MSNRNADYDWRDRVISKWSVNKDQTPFGMGNLASHFGWVGGESRWITDEELRTISFSNIKNMYSMIPSERLLYRIACTFEADVSFFGPGGYKSVWWVSLLHKPTCARLGLSEHKGAASFWTSFYSLNGVDGKHTPPAEFLADTKDLIDYFVSDVCAHPYDGLVAGHVA